MYFKCLLMISIAAIALGQKPATIPQESTDLKELTSLEAVWNEAYVRGDVTVLDGLWDNDLVFTVSGMPLMDKAESLASIRAGRIKYRTYKTSDIRIRIYQDAAVVTGQLERTRESASREFEDDWRFTKVYVRRAGKWQVVAWHSSPVG